RPRECPGLLRLVLPAPAPPLLDPPFPALPSRRSPPRRPRRSRSRSPFRTTSVRASPLAWEPNHWVYFLKFHFQSENAKPDRHSQRDDREPKPHASLLSRTLKHADLVSGSRHAPKIFWRAKAGLAAKGTISLTVRLPQRKKSPGSSRSQGDSSNPPQSGLC